MNQLTAHVGVSAFAVGAIAVLALPSSGASASLPSPRAGAPPPSAAWTSGSSLGGDTVPDPFVFADYVDAQLSAVVSSGSITVSGINATTLISISGNGGEYSINSGPYTDQPGTVVNGNGVRVRQTSSASLADTVTTTLTIGGVSSDFDVITFADTTPDMLPSFSEYDVMPNQLFTSPSFAINGLGATAPIVLESTLAADAAYSIDGGAFTTSAGTVDNGQTVSLQVRSFTVGCDFATARVKVGGASGVRNGDLQVRLHCLPPFAVDQSGNSCFIATAAYGSPLASEVDTLRAFRDRFLMTNEVGRGLVWAYCRVSPPFADFIRDRPRLRAGVRAALLPIVALSRAMLDREP